MIWPNRVWERQKNGLMASRPVTPEDWQRRRDFEDSVWGKKEATN